MFDHVKIGVSDYIARKAFFLEALEALEPLGVVAGAEGPPAYGIELIQPGGTASFCLFQSEHPPAPLHLAFVARSTHSIVRPWKPVARTMGHRVFAHITTRITMRPSSSARMVTPSRRSATAPRPDAFSE